MNALIASISAVPVRLRKIRDGDEKLIGVAALAVVIFLVAGPLVVLISTSFNSSGEVSLLPTELGFANFIEAFSPPDTLVLFLNTAAYSIFTVLIALLTGGTLAWLTERTDFGLRSFVRIVIFAWVAVPPFVSALGWIQLLNPGNGALNLLLRNTLDLSHSVFNVYSLPAMVFVTGISMSATSYIMISGVIANMDGRLESAAYVHGGSRLGTFRRITLPLLAPGLLAVGIFQLMIVVQTFDIPFAIGLTARVPVLSTRIYALATATQGQPNYGLAAAYGVVLLVVAIGLIALYLRFTRIGERFRVVTGKGFRPQRLLLGRARLPATIFVVVYFVLMAMPLLIMLWTSLLPYYQVPSWAAVTHVTPQNYAALMSDPFIINALGNTVFVVLCSATIAMTLSIVVSWLAVRKKGILGQSASILTFAPIAIPQIVFAFAILLLYLRTAIFGTLIVIVIAHVTIFTAFGTRMVSGAMLQLHQELENAAKVSGGSWLMTMRRVTFPLIFPQVLNGWLWVAAHSARDLTVPIFLMSSSNIVFASALWTIWEYPNIPQASALAVIMVGCLMLFIVPLQLLSLRHANRSRNF